MDVDKFLEQKLNEALITLGNSEVITQKLNNPTLEETILTILNRSETSKGGNP